MLQPLVALLVPPACLACRGPLRRGGEPLCPACRAALPWLGRTVCPRCALPRPCAPCPARGAAFAGAWAPLAHDGPARALVTALKFRGALAAAAVMAAQLAAGAPGTVLAGATLVPVPAHPRRRRERGFDQGVVLAHALARRTGVPVADVLSRSGPALRQLGAGRGARRAGGRVTVRLRAAAPRVAVLVDDVHTTGATLDACARALRTGGTSSVHALTYTRTLP